MRFVFFLGGWRGEVKFFVKCSRCLGVVEECVGIGFREFSDFIVYFFDEDIEFVRR